MEWNPELPGLPVAGALLGEKRTCGAGLLEFLALSCPKVRVNKTQEVFLKSHSEVYYPYLLQTPEMRPLSNMSRK